MKKILCLVTAIAILALPLGAERWNTQITITAGTPIRIAAGPPPHFFMDRLMIQSRHGNTGTIYVMLGVSASKTCNASDITQLSAELGPGDITHPGGSMSDPQGATGNQPSEAEDMTLACLDGTHSGDVAIVTGWARH